MGINHSAARHGASVVAALGLFLAAHAAAADTQSCVGKVPTLHVLSEPTPATNFMNDHRDAFEKQWKTSVSFQMFGENDRRTKSRLDAAQGSGAFQVYVIDEANVAEFASNGWILPLNDLMPADWNWSDFLPGRQAVATYKGKFWFAPFQGGGDLLMYRKDVLAAHHLEPPATVDEFVHDAALLNDPAHDLYGTALRGRRGSGMNVWRWTPFFRADGGEWVADGKAAFDQKPGIEATRTYMDLLKDSPPGSATYTWSEVVEGFRSGQVAMIIESDVFGPWAEDPQKSRIAGKVGYAPPPEPLPSAGFAHGFAISSKGNPTPCSKTVSAAFLDWATSRKAEMARINAGDLADYGRTSTLQSAEFHKLANPDYISALAATSPRTKLLIWPSPNWPRFGDELGLALESLFTGEQTDIKATLSQTADDLNELTEKQ